MTSYVSFCKKEVLESWRTYRLVIMLVAFIALGVLSPLLAKLLPDLLSGTDLGNGIILQMPPATALDSWTQYFKNIGQMGVLILVIVFCGVTGTELSKGTLTTILAKGMRRSTVILAKFSVATVIWTLSFVVSLAVTYAYTVYYWGSGPLPHALLAFGSLWVFGVLLIACMVLGGILLSTIYGALVAVAVVVVAGNLVALSPATAPYNPISLAGGTVALLDGSKTTGDFLPAVWISLALILVLLGASVAVFDKKQV
ncbi:MAG: hypothetical protein FWD75_02370 [Propionibacteriaceae bacterium]|nr:hypothetical protein [Propionibacteriaceae bacterium]